MASRAELQRARAHTDALFALVAEHALYERPVPDRHRLIFYLGHFDAFDWNLVARGALGQMSFHPAFDQLFEAGIDPALGQAPADTRADWPRVDEVRRYVWRARAKVDAVWDAAPAERQWVAIEHRWMHAETLCYLLHQLPPALKRRATREPEMRGAAPASSFITIEAGTAELGQRAGAFGWDNEFPHHTVQVPPFEIGRYKVTNADYARFVADGGPIPPFWRARDGGWMLLRMFDEVPLPLDAPVYVTHRQARAYAAWAGAELPTEAEWHRAAYDADDRPFPWGHDAPTPLHGNFDFIAWDAQPVTAHARGASAHGVEQLLGNGWEWTSTPFRGFEGFAPMAYYPGYSANFFDGDHWVLKGASPRTARRLLRRSFRNWFRSEYPYVYGTFRLLRR
jgi:iron(II)-dependent oxidoreductase